MRPSERCAHALFFCLKIEAVLFGIGSTEQSGTSRRKSGVVQGISMRVTMGAQRIRRATLISAAPGTCAVIHKHPTPGGSESREENCIGTVARFYPDPCGIVCAGRNSHRATPASVRAARPTSWGGIRMAARLSPLRRRPLCLDARPLRATAPQGSTLGRPPLGTPPWPICPGRRSLALNAMRQQKKRGTRLASNFRRTPSFLVGFGFF